MKKIAIIILVLLFAGFSDTGAVNVSYNSDSSAASLSYPLRTIVLYPAENSMQSIISADLILDAGVYKVSYRGQEYSITRVQKNLSYDSSVTIDGQVYFFRIKPRSYE